MGRVWGFVLFDVCDDHENKGLVQVRRYSEPIFTIFC